MKKITRGMLLLTLAGRLSAADAESGPIVASAKDLTLPQLEQRVLEIDTELGSLAHLSLRSGIGAIGYRSDWRNPSSASRPEWAEVDLGEEYPIDTVVLVPTLSRDSEMGFHADAFPLEFRIVAGTAHNRDGMVVAEYASSDQILPRIAPLIVPLSGIKASWIRIETSQLSQRAIDKKFVFQLSEILVFSGPENVALRSRVKTSSNIQDLADAWDEQYLVDGFLPYLMDSSQGNQSRAFVSKSGERPSLSLDLGASYPISRIHLHAVDQGDTVPQAYAGDLGLPSHLRIEGANRSDFSDAVTLLDYRRKSINHTGPIMMWRIPEKTCRYIRFVAEEPDNTLDSSSSRFRIGFAEIELFSHGQNVALGKAIHSSSTTTMSAIPLTDGQNLYGKILPFRNWINQLARRHDLETERPIIKAELTRRYAQQKTNLRRVSWLAALLAAGTIIIILIDRMIRQRAIHKTREHIAANLHDELGANLHAIGMLGDIAQDSLKDPDKLSEVVDRIRSLTDRTGDAARHCTNILEATHLCDDLVEEMKRSSYRLLADLDHQIHFKGEAALKQLTPSRRISLFLFYKECLINILRHSGATEVATQLTANDKQILLTITDNGAGLFHLEKEGVPSSLKRRARLLRARVSIEHPEASGTCITLKLKNRKWRSFPGNHHETKN